MPGKNHFKFKTHMFNVIEKFQCDVDHCTYLPNQM